MKMHHLVEAESIWALSQKGTVNLPQVKTLQDKLRAAGHDPGASDGWYGQKTANAVRSYQQANNLTVDGDAGPQTLASLGMGGANTTPPAETPPAETPPAPAPRQAATEPTARQAATQPTPTRTEPTPTRTEPEQTSTPTNRSGLPPFDRVEPSEVVRTNDDAVSQIITLWYDSNITKKQYRTFASQAIYTYIERGIIRKSAAGLIEIELEKWGEKAGIVGPDDLPIIQDKKYITTTKSAAGYTFSKIVPQLRQGVNLKRLIRQSRNELIQDGLIRESAARLHDIYVENFIRSGLNR